MLELTRFEWWETLKEFDREIIMETVTDVKKLAGEFPSIQKFYEIAAAKKKARKAIEEMERRARENATQIEYKGNPALAEKAREEIRRLCRIKGVTRFDDTSTAKK
jgi:hypothetical protein